ncbi:type I restriction enzyme, R subunit [Candidatus Electrothrix aarhusensis]|uniref:Type I restriction enzyme, R subunit n=1 Tax=Candidatus Electrothrix aarhusensis TaxID=1859131 RepID=A0A444J0D9_9BACT|nr:type I restriction enzyme, R subunit [Candidatus Electrothrix aarhusensis]
MVSKTNEQALEATIEKALTGTCREEQATSQPNSVAEQSLPYRTGQGFHQGASKDFNPKYALDEPRFWSFLETSQPQELAKLQRAGDWQVKILTRLDRMIKKYGVLHLLRKGLEIDDAHFTLFYQLASSAVVQEKFNSNQFSVIRQVHYNLDKPAEAIDMVIFCNGLPLATLELKNHWTGQSAAVNGIRQYTNERDCRQPLLSFGRCLVHFTLDTDEVYMCTRLAGKDSFFLPFNKGDTSGAHWGKGNPINPHGHKTAYLWQEIFSRSSLANIIQHFVLLSGKAKDPLSKKTLFFPRYHQLDVVRQLLDHASNNGVGHSYLIQHSAGSGKSHSITWCAYQLIATYPADKADDCPLFDSVIVVTDRRLLDKQLGDNIAAFSEVKNIVARVGSGKELKAALEQGKRIIVTTLQKFPVIVESIADLSQKRFAVLIDEAHSSQSGSGADKMNQAMGTESMEGIEGMGESEEAEDDAQDIILKAMQARKMKGNASYFAFTATPKNSTLEKFGSKQSDGSFEPFHLYSMKQAIEEGFILDVLANYTTYKSYYQIEKSIAENPLFNTNKAQKKLKSFVEQDRRTIATKAEIILEHFIDKVVRSKKLKGKAKGMVVTQSIASAIRYYQALDRILGDKGRPFKIAIAFSGEKIVDGVAYTEAGMNGFAEGDTRKRFDQDDYRLLVVANKYLTGFDQAKLCAMYVDKKLQGVLAVQALSRLNRSANGWVKRPKTCSSLISSTKSKKFRRPLAPFYTATSLSRATDVNVLHELKAVLDEPGVYEWAEVEAFSQGYFANKDAEALSPILALAEQRFSHELELDEDSKVDFKIKAKQFVKIYGQMAAIMPFEILAWEQLFWFLKFLIPKLVIQHKEAEVLDELLESVDLATYGLERTRLNQAIELDEAASEVEPANPNPRGVHEEPAEDPLDLIVNAFNARWFQGWDATPEEQKVRFISLQQHILAHPDFQAKVADNPDRQNSSLAFEKILHEVMTAQRRKELELYKLYAKDEAFQQAFFDTLWRMVCCSAEQGAPV